MTFVALAARHPQELAALSETHYHDQIESIADEVLAAGQRIVMLDQALGGGQDHLGAQNCQGGLPHAPQQPGA